MVKKMPAMWETSVGSLGWEDSLEEGIATHSRILAWRIPWTEEPGELQSTGVTKSWTQLSDFTFTSVYMSTPISQFILFPTFPPVTLILFSISMTLFLFYK